MPIKTSRSLNDTAAIQAMPDTNLQKHESRTVSVRKINNGYITSESSNKDGLYESRETFSPTPPREADDEGDSALRKAVDYMKRDGTL